MLSQFIGLAKAFSGDGQYHQSTKDLPKGWVATRKLRRMAFWTGVLALVLWVLPMEIHMPESLVVFDHVLMGLSAATCALAIWGKRLPIIFLGALTAVSVIVCLGLVCLAFLLQGQYLEAVIPGCVAGALAIIWSGWLVHFWHLKL